MKSFCSWVTCIALASGLSALAEAPGHWPGFRGPEVMGRGNHSNLPLTWSQDQNIAWKLEVPGVAWSSPVVWGDRLFLTTAIPSQAPEEPKKGLYFGGDRNRPDYPYSWETWCIHRLTGEILWKQLASESVPKTPIHLKNTYASETPVTDGEMVYSYFGAAGLYAYTLDGKLVWSKDFGAFPMMYGWGTASSPVLDEKRIFIQYDNEESSFVVALDKKTGEEIWRAERDERSAWATPFIWKNSVRTELVTAASKRVRSYDPESGKLLWELEGMSSLVCPSPFAAHDLLYVTSGYVMDLKNRPIYAIRPGAEGNITLAEGETSNKYIAWCQRFGGSYMPTPILVGDYLHVLYDRGFAGCFDAKTGEVLYEKRRIGRGGNEFTSSPWTYRDRIFFLSEDGDTFIIPTGPDFEILGKNALGEMFMASPVIADDWLYLRSKHHLYAIHEESPSSPAPAPSAN